jgi:hypothetical protein
VDAIKGVDMKEEVKLEVFNALKLGGEMRKAQKEYFKNRTQSNLTKATTAEKAFDLALEEARFAVKYGMKKPKQQTLI